MAKKKLLVTPYVNIPTRELKAMRKGLIEKANNLLKKHQYFEVSMIKEEIEMIDLQLELNRKEEGAV